MQPSGPRFTRMAAQCPASNAVHRPPSADEDRRPYLGPTNIFTGGKVVYVPLNICLFDLRDTLVNHFFPAFRHPRFALDVQCS